MGYSARLFLSSSWFGYRSAALYCLRSLYALRAGKLREAIYGIFLEVRYRWCHLFRLHSKLIVFKPSPFYRCSSEFALSIADLAATLRLHKFSVVECATQWVVTTQSADGATFGVTLDRPQVLQRAENLSSTPIELFEFNKSITCVFIPSTATRKIQHAVDKAVYAWRNRIERFFNRAKNSRRLAIRYDKLIESFAAFVLLTSIRIWIRFVQTTLPGTGGFTIGMQRRSLRGRYSGGLAT
jgi:hypothetical protein